MKLTHKLIAVLLAMAFIFALAITAATAEESDVSDVSDESVEYYHVTVNCGAGGICYISGFSPNGNVYDIPVGEPVTVTAVAGTDKSIDYFKVDGIKLSAKGKMSYEYTDDEMIDRVYDVAFKDDTSVGRDITFEGTGFAYTVNNTSVARANIGTVASISIGIYPEYKVTAVYINDEPQDIESGLTYQIVVGETNVVRVETVVLGGAHALTVTNEGNGTVTPESGAYHAGDSIELEFTPDEGYLLKQVIINGADMTAHVSDNKLTYVCGEEDISVTVSFGAAVEILFDIVGKGSILPDKTLYAVGEVVTVKFVPDFNSASSEYWLFGSLMQGETDLTESVTANNEFTFTVTEPMQYTVTFVPAILVTPNVTSGGKLYVNGIEIAASTRFAKGSELKIEVVPAIGYKVDTFRIDGELKTLDANGCYTIASSSSSVRIAIKFALSSVDKPVYTISATAGEGGSISPAGANDVYSGESLMFTFIPDNGYVVDTVTVDGFTVNISGNAYTITGITSNGNIHVTFKKDEIIIPPEDDYITSSDVDWSRATIYVNISQKTKVAKEVFEKIVASNKVCVFYNDTIKIMVPQGTSITVESDVVDLAVTVNGVGASFDTIAESIANKVGNVGYSAIAMPTDVLWPDGTTLSFNMGGEYIETTVDYYVLGLSTLASPKKPDGSAAANYATVDSDGWLCVYYFNDEYVVFVEHLEDRYTVVSTGSTGGTISPIGSKSVSVGSSTTYSIVADDGYIISNVYVDGMALEDASGEMLYSYTFEKISSDHTIEAVFAIDANAESKGNEDGQPNTGLIVAIVIIVLAVLAAAVLFFIRWKQEKY